MTIIDVRIIRWRYWIFICVVILSQNASSFLVPRVMPPSSSYSSPISNVMMVSRDKHHSILSAHPSSSQSPSSKPPGPRKYKKTQHNRKNKNNYFRKNDQLIRVIDSIIYYSQNYNNNNNDNNNDGESQERGPQASKELIEVLGKLRLARSQAQIQQAGKSLTVERILEQEPRPIQERLLKALALAGLAGHATTLLRRMLQQGYLPSHMSYTAVFSALRKTGNMDTLRSLLQELLVQASKEQQVAADTMNPVRSTTSSTHTIAVNLFLAALCDGSRPNFLEEASKWILQPEMIRREFEIIILPSLDLTSYNTVLNGAAKAGNQTLVNAVWKELTSSSNTGDVQPDIRSYNARLSATQSYEQRLTIWKALLRHAKERPDLLPDRFTIDLMLLPMIQTNNENDDDTSEKQQQQQEELETMLDAFVSSHSETIVRDSFSAFMSTLIQNGKLSNARRLFDVYIAPCLEGKDKDGDDHHDHFLDRLLDSSQRADTRHFNILIDGYRREATNAGIAVASSAVAMREGEKQRTAGNKAESEEDTKTRLLLQAKIFTRQEKAARAEGRKLFRQMNKAGILPDPFTLTSMMGLCDSSDEVVQMLINPSSKRCISAAVVRSAITACGPLGDPALACAIFDRYQSKPRINQPNNPRLWNVLLKSFSESAEQDNPTIKMDSSAPSLFLQSSSTTADTLGDETRTKHSLLTLLQDKTCTDAVREVLHLMRDTDRPWGPSPDGQTYCVGASALQYAPESGPEFAMELFRNATTQGIPADGRFVNAIFRCFGDDINQALSSWKSEIRQSCAAYESSHFSSRDNPRTRRPNNKNLIAAYNGLLHVCGRAQRPDIGVRLVYAMNREGIEPNEVSLNNYRAGKRLRNRLLGSPQTAPQITFGGGQYPKLTLPNLNMAQQYENILFVECTKYNQYDRRTSKDKRVRIIV